MIRRSKGVSPVIAVILMVAITVVLAAVAWIMVSGMLSKLDVPPTYVTLYRDPTQTNSSQRNVIVAGMDRTYNLFNFESSLSVNHTADYASSMDPIRNETVGNVTFVDQNADGKLNQGDYFIVSIQPKTDYEIQIFWKKNGSQLGIEDWYEP